MKPQTTYKVVTPVTISSDEYKELLATAERVATVERMYEQLDYVSDNDIKVALNIAKKKENNNEAV